MLGTNLVMLALATPLVPPNSHGSYTSVSSFLFEESAAQVQACMAEVV